MKKIILILSFLALSNLAGAQWYVKKYQVQDINLLTRSQLDESLKTAKNDLLVSGVVAGLGGCIFILSKYSMWTSDDPSPLEQLIGEKGMNDLYAGIGIGMMAAGTIAFFGYLERTKNIRTVIHRNFPTLGTLHLSPKINYNRYTASGNLGLTLTWNF